MSKKNWNKRKQGEKSMSNAPVGIRLERIKCLRVECQFCYNLECTQVDFSKRCKMRKVK